MSTTKILVCCHKPDNFKNDEVYMPIHVGKANSKYDLGIQGDDTGDNISKENPHFCELTGLYWAWKNMQPVDYIGLCHYRRYFNFHTHGTMFSDSTIIHSEKFDDLDLNLPNIDGLFSQYDAVIAKPRVYPYSLSVDYCVGQVSEDLLTLYEVVEAKYPDYSVDMKNVFLKNNKLSHYNMFILRWEDFNNYCEWLFDVLFEVRKKINIENYSVYQGRIWGFMSERLLQVWLLHNNKRVKHYPIYWIVDNKQQKSIFNRMQRYLRAKLAFWIVKPRKHF